MNSKLIEFLGGKLAANAWLQTRNESLGGEKPVNLPQEELDEFIDMFISGEID